MCNSPYINSTIFARCKKAHHLPQSKFWKPKIEYSHSSSPSNKSKIVSLPTSPWEEILISLPQITWENNFLFVFWKIPSFLFRSKISRVTWYRQNVFYETKVNCIFTIFNLLYNPFEIVKLTSNLETFESQLNMSHGQLIHYRQKTVHEGGIFLKKERSLSEI